MTEDLNTTEPLNPAYDQDETIVSADVPVIPHADMNEPYQQSLEDDPEAQRRMPYLKAFDAFEPAIDAVLGGHDRTKMRGHEAVIGAGTNGAVLPISVAGKEYVAKVYLSEEVAAKSVDDDFLAMERAVVDPHLAQLAGISYKRGITVMEVVPGAELSQIGVERVAAVTDRQLADALVTMRRAEDAGIDFDYSKVANFMYDTQAGFGFVDLDVARPIQHPHYQSYSEKVMRFANLLSGMGGSSFEWSNPASYTMLARETAIRLGLLGKFRSICLTQPDQESYGEALAAIDKSVTQGQDFIRDVASPGWVEQEITKRRDMEAALHAQRAGGGGRWLHTAS